MARAAAGGAAWRALRAAWLAAAVAVAAAHPAAPPASTSAASAVPATTPAAPLPAEVFFGHPAVQEAVLSPSGRRLAVTTARGGTRVGLVVFELGGAIRAQRAAQFTDVDIARVQWVNDERLVFDVVDLAAGSGADRHERPGLYAVNADGSGLRQLIARRWHPVVESRRAGPEALRWNHRLLHVPTPPAGSDGADVIVATEVYTGTGLRHLQPVWLDTVTGRTRHYDVENPGDVVEWWFDGPGQARAAVTREVTRQVIHGRAPGDGRWRELGRGDLLELPFRPRFVDDAGQLYVTHLEGPARRAVLSKFDFDAGRPSAEPWVRVDGFDFAGSLVGRGRGGEPLGVRIQADAETTVWFDERMQAAQQAADRQLPGTVNRLSCRHCGRDDLVVLVRSHSDRDPGSLWLYRPGGRHWQLVARTMDGIDPARMASVDLHRIAARDGMELPVWVTRPPGHRAGQAHPAVVLVHGGPWVRGGAWGWEPMAQFLASRGYVVISPEFRGSAGYGDRHLRAGFRQWGQAMQDDVADALLWARREGLAGEACIAGASYGGYSTLMGLIRHPELYRCGIAWAAVTDPFLLLEGSFWVVDDISAIGRRYTLPEMVGRAVEDAAMLTAASPVAQAARLRAPLLLAFGELDLRVPLAHGQRLRQAMRDAGRDPEWVTYPEEAHGWRRVANQVDWAQRMERFLARHLAAPSR